MKQILFVLSLITFAGAPLHFARGQAAAMMAQSLKSDDAGQGAGQSAQGLSTGGGGSKQNQESSPKDDPSRNGSAGDRASLGQIQEQLRARGANISPDGSQISLPDGTTVPLNASMATESGMRSADLTEGQIAMGQQSLADALAKMGSAKGGGEMVGDSGGAGGGGSDSGGGDSWHRSRRALPQPMKTPTKSSKLTGLSKNFHGDKIGIADDDIFEMISNRYRTKEANNTFLK